MYFNELNQKSLLAQRDSEAYRIFCDGKPDNINNEYLMDRNSIVNSKAFRRMADVAQMFNGENSNCYRTRMTHSLEVCQVAKMIAESLKLNVDLAETIALAHDIGHAPFGHQGERTLDEILSGKEKVGIIIDGKIINGNSIDDIIFATRCFGGFKHNYQGVRILTQLENNNSDYCGLNLSVQVIEGVLKHTNMRPKDIEIKDFLDEKYLINRLIGTVISAILRFCVEIRPLPRTTTVFAPRTTIPIRTFRQHRHCEVYF